MPPFARNLMALPARSKGILAVSTVAIVAIAFVLLKVATAPSYQLLSSGIQPSQTAKVTAALDAAGIPYELRNNGTALAVEKSSMAQANVALANGGVSLSGSQEGYALLDKSKLGASQFQQQVTYQRALEGQISNTLNSVEGVSGANVQLVMPQDDLFADSQSTATAAVTLGNMADALQPGAVRGIAQTVASSVKGLKTDNVTITDGSGQLLWPTGDSSAGGTAGSTKQAAQARYNQTLQSQLNTLLIQTLGAGKAQVSVNSDLDVDKTTQKQLTYSKKGVPLTQEKDAEKLTGSGSAAAGGAANTAANVPTYSTTGTASGAAGSGSNYNHTVTKTTLGYDKTVTSTDVAQGAVKKLNVSLVIDKSVPPATATALKNTVAAAAGVTPARGDVISMAQVPFAKAATPKTGPVPTQYLPMAKWVGLGLASLIFLFLMSRGLKKRDKEAIASPAWLREIEEPVSLAALEAGSEAGTMALPAAATPSTLEQLDQIMANDPKRLAAEVKGWMAEEAR